MAYTQLNHAKLFSNSISKLTWPKGIERNCFQNFEDKYIYSFPDEALKRVQRVRTVKVSMQNLDTNQHVS